MFDSLNSGDASTPPLEPVRVAHVTARWLEPPPYVGEAPAPFVQLEVMLEPMPPRDDLAWWERQLRDAGVGISGRGGSVEGVLQLQIRVLEWRQARDEEAVMKNERGRSMSAPF